jgi:hypothetical protein
MSRATYPLKLPHSIKKAAQRLAKEDGVSLNQWVAAAVAEKVGVIETAADFFKKRSAKAKGDGLMKFLRNAARVAPEPEDHLRLPRRPHPSFRTEQADFFFLIRSCECVGLRREKSLFLFSHFHA